MHFSIYLPVAGNSVNILLLLGLGGIVGFLSGLFGVGGGFLMTPLLIMIGIPPTVAAASDSNQIVAASASGTYAHARAGSVDFKMGTLLLIGGVAGGTGGVWLIKLLRSLGEADFLITITYVAMLGGIGSYMFYESISSLRKKKQKTQQVITEQEIKPSTYARLVGALPWKVHFKRSNVTFSALMPLVLGCMVGVLSAIMGVGGGFIMVPVMVYLLRMPMHVVVGTSLFQILFTCINVTVLQATVNHTVDLWLALFLLLGSVVGAQMGAKVNKYLNADQLKILMAVIVLVVMVKMLLGLVLAPHILVGYQGGH
ncbi:MAG: sulfite exporter TauE/SafE family protein [Thermodesulfobacteriota bacterium]